MKKIAVVLVIAAIAMYAMPVFADDAAPVAKGQEKSLFQTISDEINSAKKPARFDIKPVVKDTIEESKVVASTTVFQKVSDRIEEGSAKAKEESLRTK